ncbi:MAG: hypothetical protein U5J63_02480 [Fodinibius sp.]|nr:hypothetical protein [Fodinibius sp.]
MTIFKRDSANADADMLFHSLTDTTGKFAGTAAFDEKRRYPMIISRNQQNLAQVGIILADGDSVQISGQLPDLGATISISSREHDAMEQYQRVFKTFSA